MFVGVFVLVAGLVSQTPSEPKGSTPVIRINLEESKVRPYTLPDPLRMENGRAVSTKTDWAARRAELLKLFASQVYGQTPAPPRPIAPRYRIRSEHKEALGGTAIRREIAIEFSDRDDGPGMDLLLYLPKNAPRAAVFLGYNFSGNQSVDLDPAITPSRSTHDPRTRSDARATARQARGADSSAWPLEQIVARGYAVATACYADLDPDYDDGFANGVHPLFYKPGQTQPAADEWGSIGAWAWGLSRALDYLETVGEIDAKRVAVMGHSRLGKTSLWAGAQDPRFAVVVSIQSGCGGAALSKRDFGETVARINTSFPHWFCRNFRKYNDHEDALPVDQHELIALVAPRPVLICSAAGDQWADPKGEFLAALAADPVYKLLGTDGLEVSEMPKPAPRQLVKSPIGYHIRPGGHAVTRDDWEVLMDFADAHLGSDPSTP